MKVIVVVDSIIDIQSKVNIITNKFGDDVKYVVHSNLVDIFKTYGKTVHAIYTRECSTVIHLLLESSALDDIVVYYTSLDINPALLDKFTNIIGDKSTEVVLQPNYNAFERGYNKLYNVYVNKLTKSEDSMCCKKLQFLPQERVEELLTTHFANRLFINDDSPKKEIITTNREENKTWKKHSKEFKPLIVNLIIGLIITIMFIVSIMAFGIQYLGILIFVMLYILNVVLCFMYAFKLKFDQRFLR